MSDGNGSGAVARCLRRLRESHSLGCGELAVRIGVTPEGLHAIETGAARPSAAVLLRLSEFFAVEPAYFFGPAVPLPDAVRPERAAGAAEELEHLDGLVDRETLRLLASLSRSARKLKG